MKEREARTQDPVHMAMIEAYFRTWARVTPGEELYRLKRLAASLRQDVDQLKRDLKATRCALTKATGRKK